MSGPDTVSPRGASTAHAAASPGWRRPAVRALVPLVGVAVGFPLLGASHYAWGWLPVLVGGLVLYGALVWLTAALLRAHRGLVAALLLFAAGAIGTCGSAAWTDLTLDRRGERVAAVVVERRVTGEERTPKMRYRLRRVDGGGWVPGGELRPRSGTFQPGDRVTVLADPEGVLPPVLPGDLRHGLWGACWAALSAALWGLLASPAVGRHRR